MLTRWLIALFSVALLSSCAGTTKTNRLSVGMTKSEVIDTMGREPDSTSAKNGVEYMTYLLWRDFWDRRPGDYSDRYYVKLLNGRVDSYGRAGDFEPSKAIELNQTVNVNVKNN